MNGNDLKCEIPKEISSKPKPAKFERRINTPASEASLILAIRTKKRQDPTNADKIDEILRLATRDIEAL